MSDRPADDLTRWPVIRFREVLAWVITLIVVAGMIVVGAQWQTLHSAVVAACGAGSVVARLDLTEWVEPCLIVNGAR